MFRARTITCSDCGTQRLGHLDGHEIAAVDERCPACGSARYAPLVSPSP